MVSALREALGPGPFALHEPRFSGNESKYLQDCLASTYVSSVGRYVDQFEEQLQATTGAQHAVAVVNGTAALHVALLLSDVEEGDEVIVPDLTFVATANAVRYCGAFPHFVDSEAKTFGVDPVALRQHLAEIADMSSGVTVNRHTGRRLRAIVPVHVFGHPCDIEALLQIAKEYNLSLVEDATESLGSTVRGRAAGTFGSLGVLSFNGNKTITTGGGGAIITDDADLAHRAKHITTTARVGQGWEYVHDEVGYNYRLPNLNAALGCAQLEELPAFLASKRRLFDRYSNIFADIDGVRIVSEPPGCHSNYWLQALVLDVETSDQRDLILSATNEAGYMTRPVWQLMHRLTPYRHCPQAALAVAESLSTRIINLPSSTGLA